MIGYAKTEFMGYQWQFLWFGAWMLESSAGNELMCFKGELTLRAVLVHISVNMPYLLGFNCAYLLSFTSLFLLFSLNTILLLHCFWILSLESLQVTNPQHF